MLWIQYLSFCCLLIIGLTEKYCGPEKTWCKNGQCDEQGNSNCICDNCFSGTNCDIYVDNFVPKFAQKSYTVNVPYTASDEKRANIIRLFAIDEDSVSCNSASECPCGDVVFKILKNTKSNAFKIDEHGRVSVNQETILPLGHVYYLEVGIINKFKFISDANNWQNDLHPQSIATLQIKVSLDDNDNDNIDSSSFKAASGVDDNERVDKSKLKEFYGNVLGESESSLEYNQYNYGFDPISMHGVHSRSKRSAPSSPVNPSNITMHLFKDGKFENVTDIRPGGRVHFQLVAHFPITTSDLLIELFSPDNQTTLMILCDVKVVHFGSNIQLDPQHGGSTPFMKPVLESKDGSDEYDRAILNFGNVTCTGGGAAADNMIIVEWDVVMLNKTETINGSSYWVSAGAEYNYETEVWIGQVALEAVIVEHVPSIAPTFNFTGPSTMEIGTSAIFTLDMYIPHAMENLILDAFATLNDTDVMSVCDIKLISMGRNYECLNKHKFKSQQFPTTSKLTNAKSRLDFGVLINKRAREDDNVVADNRLTVEITMHMMDDETLIGKNYWFGASLDIGGEQIWVGQMMNLIVNKTVHSQAAGVVPTFNLSVLSTEEVIVGESIVYELEMTVPENSLATYELEVLAPFNESEPWMKICSVYHLFSGVNLPCAGCTFREDFKPEFSIRNQSTSVVDNEIVINDRAVWNLGNIKNTAHWPESLEPNANKMKFIIVVQLLNHSLSTIGNELGPIIGMTFSADKFWVGKKTVRIVSNATQATSNDTTPDFNMTYSFGNQNVPVDGISRLQFEMTSKPFAMYWPMSIDIEMPFFQGMPLATICSIELISVGKNLPCLDMKEMNKKIKLSSRSSDLTKKDVVSIDMGPVCNVRQFWQSLENVGDDKLAFSMVIRLEKHNNNTENSQTFINSAVQYESSKLWVGSMQIIAKTSMTPTLDSGVTPYVNIFSNLTDNYYNEIGLDNSASFQIVMKIPPNSRSIYKLTLTGGQGLTICNLKIVQVGMGLGCFRMSDYESNYTKFNTPNNLTEYNEKAYIDFGLISSMEMGGRNLSKDNLFDRDSIMLDVKVKQINANAPLGMSNKHVIKAELLYDMGTPINTQINLNVTSSKAKNLTGGYQFNFTRYPFHNENHTVFGSGGGNSFEVNTGQSFRTILEIMPEDNSNENVQVQFQVPPSQNGGFLEICDVNVIYAGKNMPCMLPKAIKATIFTNQTTSPAVKNYKDTAIVNFGYVCHFVFDKENLLESDTIKVESIFRLLRSINSNITDGQTTHVEAKVDINNGMKIYRKALNIIARVKDSDCTSCHEGINTSTLADLKVNLSGAFIYARPKQIFLLPVVLRVPANGSYRTIIEGQAIVNETASMTFIEMKLIDAGINLPCLLNKNNNNNNNYNMMEFKNEFNSTQNTSQNDRVVLDMGIISNSGVSYRTGNYNEGDDDLTFMVKLQMADSIVNTKDNLIPVTFKCKLGANNVVLNTQYAIKVLRDNSEEPILNVTRSGDYDLNNYFYNSSHPIQINMRIEHAQQSSAEALNATVSYYYPPYLKFSKIISTDYYYGSMPIVTVFANGHGVLFYYERIFFTDLINLKVEFIVRTDTDLPDDIDKKLANATLYSQITSNMIYRENSSFSNGHLFKTKLHDDYLIFKVQLSSKDSTTCTTPTPIGMKVDNDDMVENCRISGSQHADDTHTANDGRLDGKLFVTAARYQYDKFLQVNLGNLTRINRFTLEYKQIGTASRVKKMQIDYSNDGILWTPGEIIDMTSVAPPNYMSVNVSLMTPQSARFIRFRLINELEADKDKSYVMGVELYGCRVSNDVRMDEVCKRKGKQWLNDDDVNKLAKYFYKRAFLVDLPSNTMYFCDRTSESLQANMACYALNMATNQYKRIDKLIINILGISEVERKLYGIERNKRSYMVSLDNGESWWAVPESEYVLEMNKSGFRKARIVEWKEADDIGSNVPINSLIMNKYGGTYNGIYKESGVNVWSKVVDWTKCCNG